MTKQVLRAILVAGLLLPAGAKAQSVTWLEQGWSASERHYWHYRSLGQSLAPVSWLQALERDASGAKFLSRDYLERFGFLFEDKNRSNPLGLPVGFAVAPANSPVKGNVGLTCAACHTGQIAYKGKTIRFDGGSANHDIYAFFETFFTQLAATMSDGERWTRFATRVRAVDGTTEAVLRAEVVKALQSIAWATEATAKAPGLDVAPGPGRADALNRIGNYVFGQRLLVSANYHQNNAPANYPPLWGIWKFNWVHYNASFSQPMARNILQVLGNSGETHFVDALGRAEPVPRRWETSVDFPGAAKMEASYRKLSPPRWPARVLGPVDGAKASAGKRLFDEHCSTCHAPRPIAAPENRKAQLAVATIPLAVIGTDPAHAATFTQRRYDLSKLTNDATPISAPAGLTLAINEIEKYGYDRLGLDKKTRDELNGFGRGNHIRAPLGYKARTLDAIWASPPYLHNGSVPNVYELLSPASERSAQFWTGSSDYDPVRLGYVTAKSNENRFLFDATLPGNLNSGHEFDDASRAGVIGRKLTPQERFAIIEYLKVMDRDPPAPLPAVSADWEWAPAAKN